MITLYVLKSKVNGRRYVGISARLEQRRVEHRMRGTTVDRPLGEFSVVHTEKYPDYARVREREKFLKSGQGRVWLDQQIA